MTHHKTSRYAVAVREDGKFYNSHKSFGSTSPYFVDNPDDAEKVFPVNADRPLQPPSYYISGPFSVSMALRDCRMVWVESKTECTVL